MFLNFAGISLVFDPATKRVIVFAMLVVTQISQALYGREHSESTPGIRLDAYGIESLAIQCKHKDLKPRFDRVYAEFQADYAGKESTGHKNFQERSHPLLTKLKLRRYNPKKAFLYEAKHEMMEHARFSVLKKLIETRQSIAIFGGIRGRYQTPLPSKCEGLRERWAPQYKSLLQKDRRVNIEVIENAHRLGDISLLLMYESMVHAAFKTQFYDEVLIRNIWREKKNLPDGVARIGFSFPDIVFEGRKKVFPRQARDYVYHVHGLLRRVEKGIPGVPVRQLDQMIFDLEFLKDSHLSKREVLSKEALKRVHGIYHALIRDNTREVKERIASTLPPKDDYFHMTYAQRVYLLAWEYFLEREFDAFVAIQVSKTLAKRGAWSIPSEAIEAIDRVYHSWTNEIEWTVGEVCKTKHDNLQDLPHLPQIHFASLDFKQESVQSFRELAGYCSEPWKSRTGRIGDLVRASSLPIVALAIFLPAGPAISSALGTVASVYASAPFLSEALGGIYKAQIDSATQSPGVMKRLQANFANLYKTITGGILFHFANHLISGARVAMEAGTIWQYINFFGWTTEDQAKFLALHFGGNAVSAYRYMRSGENPFKRREYLVGFISGTIGTMAIRPVFHQDNIISQALGILMFFGTTMLIDETYQGFVSLFDPKEFDEKVAQFNMAWSGLLFLDYLILVRICRAIEGAIQASGSPHTATLSLTVSTLILLTRAYFQSNLQAGAQLRYFDDPTITNPIDAILSPKWSDFDPLDRSKGHSPDFSQFSPSAFNLMEQISGLEQEQVEALRDLLKYYSEQVDIKMMEDVWNDQSPNNPT